MRRPPALLPMLLAAALAPGTGAAEQRPAAQRPNVVLIVLDDLGIEKIGAYRATPASSPSPWTPNIDALAAQGLLFVHAYTDPLCSPSRAQILTGRHAFRTGVGGLVDNGGRVVGLSAELEATLPEVLGGYDSAAVGKWHLASPGPGGLLHPFACGFHHYAGSMFNLGVSRLDFGAGVVADCSERGLPGYSNWVKSIDPEDRAAPCLACCATYATSDTTDDALARLRTLSAPWFLYVAYNAAHAPCEPPPAALCPLPRALFTPEEIAAAGSPELAEAVTEVLDRELARLLGEIRRVDPAAYVFVISDNGTEVLAARASPDGCFDPQRSKGTLFEGGIRVPFFVLGPDVVPGRCDALVSSTDLFATIAELAGVRSQAEDSISLVPYLHGDLRPRRTTIYAEYFAPNFVSPGTPGQPPLTPRKHARALRNARYKLVRLTNEREFQNDAFFDLEQDPCEQHDLCKGLGPCGSAGLTPDQAQNLEALRDEMRAMGVY